MPERFPNEPYPNVGATDRIERKFTVYRSLLLAGAPEIVVRKHEAAFWAGAEAMFDIMAFEISELPDDMAAREMSRLKNEIWRKAQQWKKKG